uniref:Potassium channel domain-containing protein n=1 Tax=Acrobeloides nanus TaxID=290746 RepID=A0A914CK11_9BILA
MAKIQFARGIRQKDLLRANTLPSITRAKIGCFARIGCGEENARFFLLGVVIMIYLCLGALLFNYLEREYELTERKQYNHLRHSLRQKLCLNATLCKELDMLLTLHAEFAQAGYLSGVERFDLSGAFFYSGTVISTIGFGMSTPRTSVGRLVTIFYGLIGCTCCVLFFNLFLERLITAFSYFLRYLHEKKINRRMAIADAEKNLPSNNRNGMCNSYTVPNRPVTLIVTDTSDGYDSASSVDGPMEQWRPSVYKVFLCLFTFCMLVMCVAACVYSYGEKWNFIDALYFCFTSFATIGFGDFLALRANESVPANLYRVINFFLLAFGACLVYSLFNVSSIVVKQMLNWLIKKMDIKMEKPMLCRKRKTRYYGLGLRPPPGFDVSERSSMDSSGDGLLSLREFLMNNHHSSIVMLQKHLLKSASKNIEEEDPEKITATRVGPMGILNEKFGE